MSNSSNTQRSMNASVPQPYGTAIPIQTQRNGQQVPPPVAQQSPYGSGLAPAPAQRALAPGTPYRPVQAGPNSMMGYSPSQARGYGTTQPNPSTMLQSQSLPTTNPMALAERPSGHITPQQQLLAMRQQQQQQQQPQAPPRTTDDVLPPIHARPLPPQPQFSPTPYASLKLERTFNPLKEQSAPWSTQGQQPKLGVSIQGTSIVFNQSGLFAIYVATRDTPHETLLRLVNPITQHVLMFSYGSNNTAFLNLVIPVDTGDAWQIQLMIPRPQDASDEQPEVGNVYMLAHIARIA